MKILGGELRIEAPVTIHPTPAGTMTVKAPFRMWHSNKRRWVTCMTDIESYVPIQVTVKP